MTIEQRLQVAAMIVETSCRIYAPKDTGNLSINGIKSVYESGIWYVVIGGEVAPYAIYTNEPRLDGTPNRNEGWVQRAIEAVRPSIIGIFQGVYTDTEIFNYLTTLSALADVTTRERMKGVIDFDIGTKYQITY